MVLASSIRARLRKTAARLISRSESTSGEAPSRPNARERAKYRATRSPLNWSEVEARLTSSNLRPRSGSLHQRGRPRSTYLRDTRPPATPTRCTRGGAPRLSPSRATIRYLPSRPWLTPPTPPGIISPILKMTKKESHTHVVSSRV